MHAESGIPQKVYRIPIYGILRIDTHIHSNVVLINGIIFKLSSNAPILRYLCLYASSSLCVGAWYGLTSGSVDVRCQPFPPRVGSTEQIVLRWLAGWQRKW